LSGRLGLAKVQDFHEENVSLNDFSIKTEQCKEL